MISRVYLAALFSCAVALDVANNANFSKIWEACEKFGASPNFEAEQLVGPPWRIYYAWKTPLMDKECFFDMMFMKINPEIVSRFVADMAEYVEEQPDWTAAVLYVLIGRPGGESYQALLLTDRGQPGRFIVVPNFRREAIPVTEKKSVALLHLQIKLLRGGKYMVIMECLQGATGLSARLYEGPPDRADIESVAKEIALGDGRAVCG